MRHPRASSGSCSALVFGFLTALPVAWAVGVAPAAHAAQVTDVADAVDGDDPFDAHLEIKFDVRRHSGLITRENFQPPADGGPPKVVDTKELTFEHVRFRIRPRLEVGIFHDLSVFAEWPIVIWDQQSFRFADGTNEGNSTFTRDQANAPGVDNWPETEGAGNARQEIQNGRYGFPGKPYNDFRLGQNGTFNGYRQGFDNPTFGVRFSPLNNERDDTKPTITLQADYTAPFFAIMDPTNDALGDPQDPGPVADGAHRFHFSIAMSKRFLVLDPYFVVEYGLPLPAASGGSLVGYQPRQVGGFTFGVEIIPYEDIKKHQRFAIDLSANATYFSEGRDYSIVSDVLKEQTYTDQWVRTGLNAGIYFRAFEYFFFDLTGSIAYDTPHVLTIEDFGKDLPDDDNDKVNLEVVAERNPFYNPVIDTVGRRVGLEQSLHLGVLIHAGATF
jgi:hypothetical protein